jgi:hypothetical protein
MPLHIRLTVVGAASVAMVNLFAVALSPPPEGMAVGFLSSALRSTSVWPITGKFVTVIVACLLAIFLLRTTVMYHNLSLARDLNKSDPNAAEIELRPSNFVTAVTLVLSTPQPDVRILDLKPGSCGEDPIAPLPNMEDPNDFSVTFHLFRFKPLQRLCVDYRLSDVAERLSISATTDLPYVDVLRDDRVSMIYAKIWCFGGILCLLALLLLSYRCSWFRVARN